LRPEPLFFAPSAILVYGKMETAVQAADRNSHFKGVVMRKSRFLTSILAKAVLGLGVLIPLCPLNAFAQPVIPEDPFATISAEPPDGSFFRFGFGAIPPLPADFFGPGSDPFDGIVAMAGNPLDPPNFGDASTLVMRSDHPIPPSAPPGSSGMVDIEIVALDLVSTQPIVVTYDGGLDPELWDVRVMLSPTVPPPGTLSATKTHINGGIFDSFFLLQPLFVFTRVSDGTEQELDTGLLGMPALEFQTLGGPWVHDMNPALKFLAPSAGWFVPGIEELFPGDPESQVGRAIPAWETSGAAQHTIFPSLAAVSADPLATISGQEPDGSFLRFGFGIIPPLPADHFGPGSDPFEGQVALKGSHLDPTTLGDASTLVQRGGHPILPADPPGSIGTVPIEIIALDLVSCEPIVVTYNGGLDPELWDVQVTLSPASPPPGTLSATKTHVNGGVFESIFYIQPLFTFTRVMDGEQRLLDSADMGLPPLEFSIVGAPWVHAVDPALDVIAPSDPLFVPGVEELVPGYQELRRMVANEATGAARHTVFPARPDLTAVEKTPPVPLAVRSFPNPFNPSTRIEFTLPRGGQVEVTIYDLTGRLVNRLAAGVFGPGAHSVLWNGADLHGAPLASGVYTYRVIAPGAAVTGKVALVK
jgi:hypothetical protein